MAAKNLVSYLQEAEPVPPLPIFLLPGAPRGWELLPS